MNEASFDRWLKTYGEVWESQDWRRVTDLYSQDVTYHWTPFEEPKRGHEGIMNASRDATSRQRDIRFGYEVLDVRGDRGIARWWCSFTRVATGRKINLDGILIALFDDQGLCREFREWWHSDEPEDERPVRDTTDG